MCLRCAYQETLEGLHITGLMLCTSMVELNVKGEVYLDGEILPVSCGKLLWKAENERGSNDNPILLHVLTVDSRVHTYISRGNLKSKERVSSPSQASG